MSSTAPAWSEPWLAESSSAGALRRLWLRCSPQLRVSAAYVVFASLWVNYSDALMPVFFLGVERIDAVQSVKSWFFVLVTGCMLYMLVWRGMGEVRQARSDLLDSHEQNMRAWVSVIDLRHKETHDHTMRVTRMTVALAQLAGVRGRSLKNVEYGAILHDIGKVGIPDEILIKPGALDESEWEQMKQHPRIARDLLMSVNYLCASIDIPYCHHEKWDGSGYPQALRGTEIPLAARVFSVVDVWDALSFDRVYKKAWPEEKVLEHLRNQAGLHFDPAIVKLFLDHYADLKRAALTGQHRG